MKKLISLVLAAMLMAAAVCVPVYALDHINEGETPDFHGATAYDPFGDLLEWNGIVFGNVGKMVTVDGTLAVGGDVDNPTFGFNVNNTSSVTDNVALLINGDVNISSLAEVYGQTVVGNGTVTAYNMGNSTSAGWKRGDYTVADSTQYFADAKNTAEAVKAAVDALPANGVVTEANGIYTFEGNPDADILVYEVADSDFTSYRFDLNIDRNQTVVVKFTSSDTIIMDDGAVSINGVNKIQDLDFLKSFNRNIIIDIVNSNEVEMSNCDLYGTLLAPDTDLTGSGGNVCGTSIVNSLDGTVGYTLLLGSDNGFIPSVTVPDTDPSENSGETPSEQPAETVRIRIDAPKKMAVAFEDGTVYYGGENKDVEVGKEYLFQMCSVNWENGIYDGDENGLAGTVVYRMKVVHQDEFLALARAAKADSDRYVVKGMDIIDTENKTITVNCDAEDAHLETDVNSFFVAYRFHFEGEDYDNKTGIDKVINNPVESLSVNLPAGTTVTCKAYVGDRMEGTDNVFVKVNSGEEIYDDVELTSVNDYTWVL